MYNAIKWHVKARRRAELTAYFRAAYAKPPDIEESEEELDSATSTEVSFEEPGSAASTPASARSYSAVVKGEVQSVPRTEPRAEPRPESAKPLIRPSTPQRIMSEKQMKEMLARIADLEERAKQKDQEIKDLTKQAQDARSWAESASDTATEASTAVNTVTGSAVVRAKTFLPRLVPYTNEKDDIRLYIRRFESYARTLNLTEDQQVSEFIAHGRGPIESIVLSKDLDTWTMEDLKATCLLRLAPNWDMNRIEQEMYKIKVDMNDDPDAVMNKIVKVTIKRDDDVPIARLRQAQFNHFIRLIHMHEPMHTYVLNECKDTTDPDLAVGAAKKYLKEKGNDVTYFRSLVQQSLKDAGVAAKEVDHSIFPLMPQTSAPSTEPAAQAGASAKVTTVAETTTQQKPAESSATQEFVEQFVKKSEKLSTEAMNRRFNDLERLMRDLHVAGLPDFLKKKGDSDKFDKNKSSAKDSSKSSANNDKPFKRRFEKNNKGQDKRYKKKFVEKESGEILAQYVTDESDSEETKDE